MKTPLKKKAPRKPRPVLHPLRPVGIAISATEAQILKQLAIEQRDLTGRAVSGSCIVRALIRLAKRKSEGVELRDEIEREFGAGRKWGIDQLGRIQGRGRPR